MMTTLLSVLLSIAALTIRPLPPGTQLHIRLTTAVGSYASVPGSPVSALLIAPVIVDGETVLEAGSILNGRVKSVTRVGYGLRHETAGLNLEFSQITPPDGETIPLSAQVAGVDNSRERVTRDGRIQGVHRGEFVARDLAGVIDGDTVELRSSLPEQTIGNALNFTFTGKINGDTMSGDLDMGDRCQVALDRGGEFAFHALHVIDVVLKEEVVRTDIADHVQCLR